MHTCDLYIYIYDCRPKGPCRDCPLQRPPWFQHETPRKFCLRSRHESICLFGERFSERFSHEIPTKDKCGVRERFAEVFVYSRRMAVCRQRNSDQLEIYKYVLNMQY